MKERLYDITEVCKTLGVTSRTLRFYEEKKLITSEKDVFSSRRKYTEAQVEQIRYVLVLRALGLSVKAIKEIQTKNRDLKSAVQLKRAEIIASIQTKRRELMILNDALVRIEAGGNLLEKRQPSDIPTDEISQLCMEAVISEDTDLLYQHICPKLAEYMPKSVYETVRADTLAPLGAFIELERIQQDSMVSNIVYGYVKYEKLGMRIKLVFHGDKIDGLWLSYYEPKKEKET